MQGFPSGFKVRVRGTPFSVVKGSLNKIYGFIILKKPFKH